MKLFANPIVGRTGLSNMLFIWARAELFCKCSGAQMLAPQWVNLWRIGPWLRMEQDKRYYFNAFSNRDYIKGLRRWWVLITGKHVDEQGFLALEIAETGREYSVGNAQQWTSNKGQLASNFKGSRVCRSIIIDFRGMDDFFNPFLKAQEYIRNRLWMITSLDIKKNVEHFPTEPFIGVHIRRGDFTRGAIAISDEWYILAIQKALEKANKIGVNPLIRVFSDAKPESLVFLKERFSNLMIMPAAPALQDLWLLSKASILVATSRSTFSMWAVFLGQMASIWHSCETPPRMSMDGRLAVNILDHGSTIISVKG